MPNKLRLFFVILSFVLLSGCAAQGASVDESGGVSANNSIAAPSEISSADNSAITSNTSSVEVPKVPPEIHITVGGQSFNYARSKKVWDGKEYNAQPFIKLCKGQSASSTFTHVNFGTVAMVDFGDYPPEAVAIRDAIIQESGAYMYDDRVTMDVEFQLEEGKCTFIIAENLASCLSSQMHETDYRGISIMARWGDNKCEYGFVIETDVP